MGSFKHFATILCAAAAITAGAQTNSTDAFGRYAMLVRTELELGAQQRLLVDLAQLHAKRAGDMERSNRTDVATWERALARELEERGSATLRDISGVARERVALEEAQKLLSSAVFNALPLTGTNAPDPNSIAYLARIEEQLHDIDQDLARLADEGREAALQLQTNNVWEDAYRISASLRENRRDFRELQRDRAALELKKLELRVIKSR